MDLSNHFQVTITVQVTRPKDATYHQGVSRLTLNELYHLTGEHDYEMRLGMIDHATRDALAVAIDAYEKAHPLPVKSLDTFTRGGPSDGG